MKNYRLKKEQIKQLIPPMGGCLATDMITVDGECIMFMYREHPKNQMDSGWRFFSGLEDEKYMRNNDNHSVYDVNTIANYDPSIIPYLDAEVGSSFERDEKTSLFNKILE